MLLVAAVLSGCSAHDVETESPADPVVVVDDGPIELVFACTPSTQANTRLADEVYQPNNETSYREITDFHFVAFKKEGNSYRYISNAQVDNQQGPENKENNQIVSRYYHFDYCDMPMGTNGCMVYAKAKDINKGSVMATRTYNGCLNYVIPTFLRSTSDIFYEPVSIYGDATVGEDGVHADAWTLANALTDIANVSTQDGSSYWRNLDNNQLKPLFAHFTNYGYDLPGSAASVRKWIEAVRDAADDYRFGDGTIDEFIRQAIIAQADASLTAIDGMTYPQNINLPDGAAALRWAEVEENGSTVKKFVPQLQTTTLDDINSVSRFVYPPALYYFVESDIKTSTSPVKFETYRNDASWTIVLNRFTDAPIGSSTKTVAVKDPLQYAVARLLLKVKVADDADATKLKYNGDNTIDYNDGSGTNYIRLTGVIIGGQRTVGYDFKPINNSDMDVKFIYDSQVADGNGFYLKKGSTDEFNTLVLQSYDGEDLNVILEFEYSGSQEFKCLNGWVYPGTRFYLVGEVKLENGTGGDQYSQGRVFTQDHWTTIQMTVSSLEKAYNVLPSILAKNLEIGVKTTPVWTAATPGSVIME